MKLAPTGVTSLRPAMRELNAYASGRGALALALSQAAKSLYHQPENAGESIHAIMFDDLITAMVNKHVSVHAE